MTHILIIDDDKAFREVLSDALARRGHAVSHAASSEEAVRTARSQEPEWIVLDLKIGHESGLQLIPQLLALDPYTRILVLTGYASVGTAVEAIKLGAVHYLAKPAEAQQILAAFEKREGNPLIPIAAPQSVLTLEREHISAALARSGGNISAAARELRMHRRTLQRKLDKMP